jgi:hypothetical protein
MDSNVPSNSKWNLEFKLLKGPFFHVGCVCVFFLILQYTHILGKNNNRKNVKNKG